MKKIIPFLIILILFNNLLSQKLHIKNYTTNDGLPSSQVWCALQDSKGYIWFGTSNGLVKYNGQEFVTYKVSDGLVSSVVLALLEDNGNIWITTDNGISCFNGESFTNYVLYDSLNFGIVWCVAKYKDCLCFGTKRRGLFKFDPDKAGGKNKGFVQIKSASEKEELSLTSIFFLATDNNYLWIANSDGGLFRYDGKDFFNYTKYFDLKNKILTNLLIVDSTLWLGTAKNGLFKCNLNKIYANVEKSESAINYFPNDYIYFAAAKDKSLFIGTRGNGFIYYKNKPIRYTTANGLINNLVYSILVDKENSIWLSTNKGITKILSQKFLGYLENKTVLSVCEYKGAIWLGTFENGLIRLEGNNITTFTTKDGLLSNNQIVALTVFNNELWIGNWGGLNSYDGKTIKQYTEKDGFNKIPILTLLPVENSLWIGTVNRVWKYQPQKMANKFTLYTAEDGLTNTYFQAMSQDSNKVWFGTPGGAFCYDPNRSGEKFVKLSTKDGLSADCINAIFKDRNGTLWFGTPNGLNKYEPEKEKKFRLYTTQNSLSDNNIMSITQLGKYLWLATSNGLNKFDGKKVVKIYDQKSGLIGNEATTSNSLYRDSKNHIWLCTYNGVTEYIPENDILNEISPPVYIDKFFIKDSLITGQQNLKFEYDRNTAKFFYVGLSFKNEDDVRYKYKLDGYDKDWSDITQKKEVRYTNLDNGSYTFKVLAQNGDGYWSETPAEISFKIVPPFWKTWWFILIELLIICVIIYGAFLFKTAQIRRRAKVLEQKVDERTAELRDTQKTLVDVAHRAGMAEIATGILHNVGNVLNSVKVSSQILKERIEKSKISGLKSALGLIEEHSVNLSSYITSDEKGKMLPEYLIKVGKALENEQDSYLNELSNLHNGIDHIEEIVSMQQDYAGGSGIVESASLSKMMGDVLRMNQDIFNKHKIQVVKHFKETAPISAEKGKLMQVFVNIIKNAWQSLEMKDDKDKVISISISEDEENKCQIVDIIDNGIGIAKENLNKMFSYGFTTKDDGKGFGLHTSALAISELKGRITASSDGESKGAKFTVIVPINR